MDDSNASIKKTLARFEADCNNSLGVQAILLDTSFIVQCDKKLGSPRKLTATSLITSWLSESNASLETVQKAWADLSKRRACCLQPERCAGKDDPENFKVRKFKYKHNECAELAAYWAVKLRTLTLRSANLRVALAIVNERQLDLTSFRKQARRAMKKKTGTVRPSSFPTAATETGGTMQARCASPEPPPPLLAVKEDKEKDKHKRDKSVSFAQSADQLGQEATSRCKRSFNRCKPDNYVPGRWAPPNRKATTTTAYPLEPFSPDGRPSFFNTYADYDDPATPRPSPGPSDSEPLLEPDDLFLDTSGVRLDPSAFYHDDPLLDAEERALEVERQAVWDAFIAPVPAARKSLLDRVKRRWSCGF